MMRDPARSIVGMDVGGANLKYAFLSRVTGSRRLAVEQHASAEGKASGHQESEYQEAEYQESGHQEANFQEAGLDHCAGPVLSEREGLAGSTSRGSVARLRVHHETIIGTPAAKLTEVWSSPFPMWTRFLDLADQLVEALRTHANWQQLDALAVTMTGELADCFTDRAEGVRHIVDHVCKAARRLHVDHVFFYGVDGRFHTPQESFQDVDRIAAANWHVLGSFVARTFCSDGMLIDVGSTTCDIIPLKQGTIATGASTDHERLGEGSLVYLGGTRTPVASLVDELRHEGKSIPVMREWFATMDDVRILLGLTPEDPDDHQSADGKPRSADLAANRLARMIGLDRRHVSQGQAVQLAAQIHAVARQKISKAVERMCQQSGDPQAWVISGHAPDLIQTPAGASVIRLRDQLGDDAARSAPAVAVAHQLHREQPELLESCDG